MECKIKSRDLLLIRYAGATISGGVIHPPSGKANSYVSRCGESHESKICENENFNCPN